MQFDTTSKGLLALAPGGRGAAIYDVPKYPAELDSVTISFMRGDMESPNHRSVAAEHFLESNKIAFTTRQGGASGHNDHSITITGKDNTRDFLDLLVGISQAPDDRKLQRWQTNGATAPGIAESVLWETAGQWLQRSLEKNPPAVASDEAMTREIKERAMKLMERFGKPEKQAPITGNLHHLHMTNVARASANTELHTLPENTLPASQTEKARAFGETMSRIADSLSVGEMQR